MAFKHKALASFLTAAALQTAGCAQPPARSTPEPMMGLTCNTRGGQPEFKGETSRAWMQFNANGTLSVVATTFGPVKGEQEACTLRGALHFSCDDNKISGTIDSFTATATRQDIETGTKTPATAAIGDRLEVIRENPRLCIANAL